MKDALPARTLLDYFDHAATSGKAELLVSKVDGKWKAISAEEFGRRVKGLALGLQARGVDRGDRVAILSENRPEWPITDFATLALGALTVPIYTTYFSPQVEYILKDAQAKVVVVSNKVELQKVLDCLNRCPDLRWVLLIEEADLPNNDKVVAFSSVERQGEQLLQVDRLAFDERVQDLDPDDFATLIYTSGTTGEPKGAVLSHGNMVSNVTTTSRMFDVDQSMIALSFLPLSHVFERMVDYLYFSRRVTITYAESIDKLAENFGEIKPHIFAAVPRVYEKIHARIKTMVEASPNLRQKIFAWAEETGKQRLEKLQDTKPVGGMLELKASIADKLVFGKIKARLGGRFLYAISGGAPLSKHVAEFFWAAGVKIFEGYGLTETSPVITCNRPDAWRLGSVGKPIPGVTIRIAEDGEVLAKGPNIMKGYWGKPEETEKSIDKEGWFHTGDIGYFDDQGFLFLTDRKKELIINAYGKNIAPAPIEGALKMVRYIGAAVLIGDQRKFLSALVVPNFEKLESWAMANGHEFRSREDLIRNPKVRGLIQQAIDIVNGDEPSERRIKAFALVPNDFSIEGGELTPTLKVKRRVIVQKYKDLIDQMYEVAESRSDAEEEQ